MDKISYDQISIFESKVLLTYGIEPSLCVCVGEGGDVKHLLDQTRNFFKILIFVRHKLMNN